jgi:HemY protein
VIKFLLLVLIALAIGASAAFYIRADAGYVQIAWRSWILETSLLGFALAVAAGVFVLIYGVRLLLAGLRLPGMLRGAMNERRTRRATGSFEEGLLHLLEGRWRKAEIELIRRAADHPARGLNYLFAADAALRLDASDRAERYLQQAAESAPVAASLARARHAAERGDWPGARQLLLKLFEQDPKHEQVVEQLAEVHAQVSDWETLDKLLSAAQFLPAGRVDAWRRRVARGRMDAALSRSRLDEFKGAWEALPAALRAEPELRQTYVSGLLRLNAESDATAQITAALRQTWDGPLAKLYGGLQGIDALTQLATAEQWLVQYGEKPELLLIAARACSRNRLWGKARSYLEGLVRVQPSVEAYLELAQLCQQTQAPEDAARYYRQGLELAAKTS